MTNQSIIPLPSTADGLESESDVEQKFLAPFLSNAQPFGLTIPPTCIFTKANIRAFSIGKGTSAKLYYPDYLVVFYGLPVLVVEAKAPDVADLIEAAREARLYAGEINSCYPSGINPCIFCLVSNGMVTELRKSDSDEVIQSFSLQDAHAGTESFAAIVTALACKMLMQCAGEIHARLKPRKFERPLNLIGGTSARNEQIEYNQFGRLLTSRFQNLFNPSSWEDRKKIVEDAYVPSRRRTRYVDEIDSLIRSSAPPVVTQAQLIEDTGTPKEITSRLSQPNELRNKVLLLIGAVGSGKSTFVDYLQNVALAPELVAATTWVRLDLNEAPVSVNEVYTWCRASIINGLREAFPQVDLLSPVGARKLYKDEVDDFDSFNAELFPRESLEYKTRFADLITSLRRDDAG
ncbi:hypothetical protein WJU23_19985, partial [Prosthecobacter sp. SYSU 5D2]